MLMSSSVTMTCFTTGSESSAAMAFLPSPARFLMDATTDHPQHPPSVARTAATWIPARPSTRAQAASVAGPLSQSFSHGICRA